MPDDEKLRLPSVTYTKKKIVGGSISKNSFCMKAMYAETIFIRWNIFNCTRDNLKGFHKFFNSFQKLVFPQYDLSKRLENISKFEHISQSLFPFLRFWLYDNKLL